MRFEWDEGKSRRNLVKHKISFETAKLAFEDPLQRTLQDRGVDGEQRWQPIGMMKGLVVVVAHTYREEHGEPVIRIISARKVTPAERRAYEGH